MKRSSWLWLLALVLVAGGWSLSRALIPTAAGDHVTRGKVVNIVIGSVTVSAEKESQIVTPQEGIVKESHLTTGQMVQAGDVLARLDEGTLPFDRTEAKLNLDNLESQLAPTNKLKSERELENAQKALNLATPLFQQAPPMIAPEDYNKLKKDVDDQTALAKQERDDLSKQVAVLKNQLAKYDDQLERLKITAPYEGVITAVLAHQGDLVAKNTPVASIISRKLRILAEVNQDDIANVFEKEEADVRFTAYGTKRFTAAVLKVLPNSDKTTQRFTVELELKEPPLNLMAGLTGEVIFHAGEHDNALRIPRRALYGNNVLVVKSGRVEKRSVKPGFVTLMQAEILPDANPQATVAEGEVVLTDSLDLFRNGDRVRVIVPADAAQK